MNQKRSIIAIILAIFLLLALFSSCSRPDENEKPSGDDNCEGDIPGENPDETPEITEAEIFLVNKAEWKDVYCYLYNENDEFLCEIELFSDSYGIYSAVIPGECKYFVFTDKESGTTPILSVPEGDRNIFDNKREIWTSFSEATKKEINIGSNMINITSENIKQGSEYVLFHVESDGLYTFTSDRLIEIGIVVVEMKEGNWDPGSEDWRMFSNPLNQAYLTEGEYYMCLMNLSEVPEGEYEITLQYSEESEDQFAFENCVFSNGESWLYFHTNEIPILTAMNSAGQTFDYRYMVLERQGEVTLFLTLLSEGEDFVIDGDSLATLSHFGKVIIGEDMLLVGDEEFNLCTDNS